MLFTCIMNPSTYHSMRVPRILIGLMSSLSGHHVKWNWDLSWDTFELLCRHPKGETVDTPKLHSVAIMDHDSTAYGWQQPRAKKQPNYNHGAPYTVTARLLGQLCMYSHNYQYSRFYVSYMNKQTKCPSVIDVVWSLYTALSTSETTDKVLVMIIRTWG